MNKTHYSEFVKSIAQGWNTWNTRSVTSHVFLPDAFSIGLGMREYRDGGCLKQALVGRVGEGVETVVPGAHAYDGSYTSLTLNWRDTTWRIETATEGADWVARVTPLQQQLKPAALIVEIAMLWNRPGLLRRETDRLVAQLPEREITVFTTGTIVEDPWPGESTPYWVIPLTTPVGISTGKSRDLATIDAIIARRRHEHEHRPSRAGESWEVYDAMQSCVAWNTIYDPIKGRVVSPVSRVWSCRSGGYTLFCWDNYFAAFLASFESESLAYANAIEITREAVDAGFVPNSTNGVFCSNDRSQPPVGSAMVLAIYQRWGQRWFIAEVFDALLKWNRWWPVNRDTDGLLCWGSSPYEPTVGNVWETNGVNARFGAALESGLDNSPMYDDIPFDTERHQLKLADVGLTGLYVWDCDSLAELADILGRTAEATELRERAEHYRVALKSLWDDDFGLFLNRRTDTGAFERRISPTNFYALLAKAATPEQARRMVDEHLLNPEEFWGEWVLPSIARNDPAYPEQHYWRGRIWAPMNFLVYLGLRNYDLPEVRQQLAEKSKKLLLKEWREHGHVHENYCGDTGSGCNREDSDRFYHWGGLLGAISLLETRHTS